jgi:hypothetical protein
MAYSSIPSNPFTVPGSAAGFLDIRKKGTTTPVVTVAVPAYTAPSGGGGTPTSGVLTITGANQQYNNRQEANSGGTRYSANTLVTFTTNQDNFIYRTYGHNESSSTIAPGFVWVNGVEVGPIAGTLNGGITGAADYPVTGLPGSGTRTVQVYTAGQLNPLDANPNVSYLSPTAIVLPTGATGSITPVTLQPNMARVRSNSHSVGGGHGNAAFSWPRYLNRQYRPAYDIYVDGHAGALLNTFVKDATARAASLSLYKAARANHTGIGIDILADEVNDYGNNTCTPTELKNNLVSYAQAWLADTAIPSGDLLFFMSAFPAANEAAPSGGFPLATYRSAIQSAVGVVSNARVRYIHGPDMVTANYLNSDGIHYSIAGDMYAAGKIDAALSAAGGGGGGGTAPVPTFQVVDSQDFESSSSLPANYDQNALFSVVPGEPSTSGTRSVKITAQAGPNDAIGDTTHSFAEGRWSVNMQAVRGSGTMYPNLRFNVANGSQYNLLLELLSGGQQTIFLQKAVSGASAVNLGNGLIITPALSGFQKYTIERIGNSLKVYVLRLSDNMYLTGGGDFTSATRVACLSFNDNNPLPAGLAKFSAYISEVSAGNACYFDDAVLEKYA